MNILIVDDSRAMRMIVKRTLRQAGINTTSVQEASNGNEALTIIASKRIDLVLCDWNMPEMSGIELLQKLNEENIHVRFGFITSEGSVEKRVQAREAGASFLLTKPFNAEGFQKAFNGSLAA